jgi:hypothetical protein
MKKQKFTPAHEQHYDFTIFDLATSLPDYKLAYFLNNNLGFHLERSDDLEVSQPNSEKPDVFSFYYCEKDKGRTMFLIHDINANNSLMKSYFLIIQGYFSKNEEKDLLSGISTIPEIFSINKIKIKDGGQQQAALKKKTAFVNTMLTDLEFHLIEMKRRKNEEKVSLKIKDKGTIKKLYC